MSLTSDQVRHLAKLARLKIKEEETSQYASELSKILEYVAILNELDTEDIPPTAQVTGLTGILREDTVSSPLATKEDLLACSPLPIVQDHIETMSAHG